MFATNLGSSTERVIGAGLVKGHLVDRSQVHARLRFDRRDGTKIYVKLNNVEGKGIRASVREWQPVLQNTLCIAAPIF